MTARAEDHLRRTKRPPPCITFTLTDLFYMYIKNKHNSGLASSVIFNVDETDSRSFVNFIGF